RRYVVDCYLRRSKCAWNEASQRRQRMARRAGHQGAEDQRLDEQHRGGQSGGRSAVGLRRGSIQTTGYEKSAALEIGRAERPADEDGGEKKEGCGLANRPLRHASGEEGRSPKLEKNESSSSARRDQGLQRRRSDDHLQRLTKWRRSLGHQRTILEDR